VRKISQKLALFLSVLLILSGTSGSLVALAAPNDYVSVTKSVNPSTITIEEEAEVTLSITGSPPSNVIVPNDVVLIIDRSGSMANDNRMTNAIGAAKGFVDLMDMTKHRVAVVDYSDSARSYPFTTDTEAVKNYINGIREGGNTATGGAIQKAIEMLADHRPEAQPVIVIMTDGAATVGGSGLDAYDYAKLKAMEAKDAGIIFYTIALLGPNEDPESSSPNKLLKEMATTSSHHHFVLGSAGLGEIYAAIVSEIGMASAYNVVVTDQVSSNFEIVPGSYDNNIPKPTVNGNTLVWEFNELKNKTLSFTYKIRPVSKNKTGNLPVGTDTANIVYKDYAGAARYKQIPNATLKVNYPAPVITSIVEASGPPAGGQVVTINGKNYLSGATVKFANQSATNVTVVSATEIKVTVPAGTQGTAKVVVTNPDGQSAEGAYQYIIDPIITQITPDNGPLEGGTSVVIYGKYFMPGAQITLGGNKATVTTNNGLTMIQIKTPAATDAGPVDVTLTNPDGTSVTVPGGYTYNEPPKVLLSVTKVSPDHGALAGGTVVYMDGTKFERTSKVYFGNNEATLVNYMSDKRIVVSTSAASTAGVVDVKVINSDGETVIVSNGYTYDAPPALPSPTITKINPNSGLTTGGYIAYIDGTNFVSGAKVFFGDNQAIVNATTANRITVTVPVSNTAEIVDLKVINPDSQSAQLQKGFTYLTPPPPPAPIITKISPNSGPAEGGTVVYIDGSNFVNGAKVYLGNQSGTVISTIPTRIGVTVPAFPAGGQVDVKVVNPDGQDVTLANGYTYVVPVPEPVEVTSLSPNTGLLSGGTIVYIDGSGFKTGAKVTFGSTTVNGTFMSAKRIYATLPSAASEGAVDVTVTNPDGMSGTLAASFNYTAPLPTITRVSPTNVPMAGGTVVYIDGTNFETNMNINVNGNNVPILSYLSSTRVAITAPKSTVAGQVPIVITLASGKSVTGTLTYDAPPPAPAPNITKITAMGSAPAGGYVAYIDGANFVSGFKVYFGTNEATFISMSGANRIMVYVPAGSPGPVKVKVVNPDGQTSNLLDFTYQ